MKKLKDSQFIRIITKIKNKLFENKKEIGFFLCLVVVGIFFVVHSAEAQTISDIKSGIIDAFSDFLNLLNKVVVEGINFLFEFFLKLAKYNSYIDTNIVKVGWILVRDVANMFFVVIMLVIAFGTILGLENYQWNKLLGKLIFAAIFINFSNMICGLIIDIAYVFSLTFLNAIVNTAGANLINTVHMDKLNNFDPSTEVENSTMILVSNFVALMFSIILLLTIGAFAIIMLLRMVMLWILIILSPLAFIMQVMPQTQEYAKQWWGKFTKQVLVLPVMVFFLWLTLSTMSGGTIADDLGVGMGGSLFESENSTIAQITRFDNLANFFVPIAMLVTALTMVGQMGVVGGGLAGKALDFGKKVATVATGYALGRKIAGGAWQGTKFVAKKAAMNVPIVGGKAWVRRGQAISGLGGIVGSKINQARNKGAQWLEKSSKDRGKLKDDFRKGKISEDQYKQGLAEMGHNGTLGAIGRFGKRLLAGRVESSGRADKRAENWKKAAEAERQVEEADYSLSGTSGGRRKTYNEARADEAKKKQEGKSSQKRDEWLTAFANKANSDLTTTQEEQKQAEEELARLSESQTVHENKATAKTQLDEARQERDKKNQAVVEVTGEIKVEQDRLNEVDGKLNPEISEHLVKMGDGAKKGLSEIVDSLGEEDRALVEAKVQEWQTADGREYKGDELKLQQGEALRQLLAGNEIVGNNDFNAAARGLFVEDLSAKVGPLSESEGKLFTQAQADQKTSSEIKETITKKQKELETATEDLQEYTGEGGQYTAAEAEYNKWTPAGVSAQKMQLEAEIEKEDTPEGRRQKARQELATLSTPVGSEEEIAAARQKVDVAKKRITKLVEKSPTLQAMSAKKAAEVAAQSREQAEGELGNKFDLTEAGAKMIEALNKIEFGKKQAEDFSKNLKTEKINKAFAEAVKKMENVNLTWQKTGNGDLNKLEQLLSEAAKENIFVRAAVQAQKTEEKTSEQTQLQQKMENWAGDLVRNIPRGGRTNSTVMSSMMEKSVAEWNTYDRASASKQAVKNIFTIAKKRKDGQELDLEDRRKAMSAWLKIDGESWNDDFFHAMITMIQNKSSLTDPQERAVAEEMESFLNSSGIKYGVDSKTGKYKIDKGYGRSFSSLMQNLATTGGDYQFALAHEHVSRVQEEEFKRTGKKKDYWEVAAKEKKLEILQKGYDENQDYIQVAATEFKKNAIKNGHIESGLNQEFDISRGIYRFNSALEAEAGMLTEMSKMTQAQLLQFQIHSFGERNMNTGLMESISSTMFGAITKNLKDEFELRSMNPRNLLQLMGYGEDEQVDTSGGLVHFGGQRVLESYKNLDGTVDKEAVDDHLMKNLLLKELMGNARGFGLMIKRLFNVDANKLAKGTFTIKLAGGRTVEGVTGIKAEIERMRDAGKLGDMTDDEFKKTLEKLDSIVNDWSEGHVLTPSSSSRRRESIMEEAS